MLISNITELLQGTSESPVEASLPAQLQKITPRTTKGGKPYFELELADATATFKLKAWSDHPQFSSLGDLRAGSLLDLRGQWTQNQYGVDGHNWSFSALEGAQVGAFFTGDSKIQELQEQHWQELIEGLSTIKDPRLSALCERFIDEYGDRFRRSAAAKQNHHARRGGLLEHVSQMSKSAVALASVYPELNLDLLLAAILFHDSGKIWENGYGEKSFAQSCHLAGEMLGHIPLGLELVNKLWRDLLETPEAQDWRTLEPASDHVRLHLLHLIASHHGEYQFGTPTLPRTPEAMALHHIDNLDAKLEMFRRGYQNSPETSPGVHDRVFPLPANLVDPLPSFEE